MVDEQPLREALSANISRFRQARGWSQDQLAEAIGISRVQVNRIENGHHTPGADILYSIADALGVTTDQLRQVSEKIGSNR